MTHGVYRAGPFSIVHAGQGSMHLGALAPDHEVNALADESALQRVLCSLPALSASMVESPVLLQMQLEKLAINAIINPLTALLYCHNGKLFNRPAVLQLIRALLVEISTVTKALIHPLDRVTTRFSPEALERTVAKAAAVTAENKSSMWQDVLDDRRTEIDYINGYIVQRGFEHGIDCRLNAMMVSMVKSRERMSEGEIPRLLRS